MHELLNTVYHYYPRGISNDDPHYKEQEEYLRLVSARRKAGAERGAWLAFLQRMEEHFPGNSVQDDSLHLVSGNYDACYSGTLYLPTVPGEHGHKLLFLVSFISRYYSIISVRTSEDVERTAAARASQARSVCVFAHDTCYVVPADIVKPEVVAGQKPICIFKDDIRLDLLPDEEPYGAWIAREIEATWSYERMPPEIAAQSVPNAATDSRGIGEATLSDCLFRTVV